MQKPNFSLTQEGGAIGLQKCKRGDEFEITFEEFKNTDEESEITLRDVFISGDITLDEFNSTFR